MRDTTSAPIRIHVTETPGLRQPLDLPEDDPLIAALAAHLQRIACEGARAAWAMVPRSRDWIETETGLTGWRSQISPDTAHLIHVVEELGLMEFDDA